MLTKNIHCCLSASVISSASILRSGLDARHNAVNQRFPNVGIVFPVRSIPVSQFGSGVARKFERWGKRSIFPTSGSGQTGVDKHCVVISFILFIYFLVF